MQRGQPVYSLDDDGPRGRRAPDDFMALGTAQVPRQRRVARVATRETRRRRRYLYWLGLVEQAGMTFREIAAESGFAVSTIYDGVVWARNHGEAWLRSQIQDAG